MLLESLLVGISASFIASLVWLAALRFVRPRVAIAPKACFSPKDNLLTVKVINQSRRALVNIRVELAILTQVNAPGGLVGRREVIRLYSPEPLAIEGRKRNNDDRNAYRFRAQVKLEDIWRSPSSALRISIFCQDEVSGVGKLTQKTFFHRSEIVEGDYTKGQDFAIVSASPQAEAHSSQASSRPSKTCGTEEEET